MPWSNTILLFFGGGIGVVFRGLLMPASQLPVPWAFPSMITTTNLINALGSLIIGFLMEIPLSAELRYFLVWGVLGGFTTFSGFSVEFLQLMQNKNWSTGFLYVISSVSLSLILVWAGNRLYSLFT